MLFKTSNRVLLFALLILVSLSAGCGRDRGDDRVVARVGHTSITYSDLQQRLIELPPYARQQFATPEGMIDLLNRMVEEEVLYQAAENAGYATRPEVTKPAEAVKKRAMVQAFYHDQIEEGVQIPDADIQAYYEEYADSFQDPARIRFRHIMTDTRAAAVEARRRVLAGEPFATVAREMTTDASTRDAGGLTKSVRQGHGLPRLGMDEAFIERLFALDVGAVSDPMQSEKGWHVVRLEEKQEAGTKPLDEVREDIEQTLRPDAVKKRYEEVFAELKQKFNARIDEDAVRPKLHSEEEIFSLAQETEDPLKRLSLYRELLFTYPNGEHAPEAQFMIGFIYAEELKNYEAADLEFNVMLERYPDSELSDSAKWMLDNMRSEDPSFEDMAKPATE